MHIHRSVITLGLMLLILMVLSDLSPNDETPSRRKRDSTHKTGDIILLDNSVFRCAHGKIEKLDIPCCVRRTYSFRGILYYLRKEHIENTQWHIGYRDLNDGTSFESEVNITIKDRHIRRFFGCGSTAYVLAERDEKRNVLYRVDLNTMHMVTADVCDATLVDHTLYTIQKKAKRLVEFYLDANGKTIPLTLEHEPVFTGVVDNRILFISDEAETEIIDIHLFRNLYRYSRHVAYAQPEDYNLVVETFDEEIDKGERESIFYKIFINGRETGRTETGIPPVTKSFRAMLTPNSYQIIKLERWELDSSRKRYFRANNIHQPSPLRLFIPENRILKVVIIFNGKRYSFQKGLIPSEN